MKTMWVLGAGLWLAGCASQAPMHVYSLYAPDVVRQAPGAATGVAQPAHGVRVDGAGPAAAGLPDLRFELGRVSVPERLNRPNIVLHPARATTATAAPGAVSSVSARGGARAAAAVEAAETSGRRLDEGQSDEAAVSLRILENHRLDAVFGEAFRDALATQLAVLGAEPTGTAQAVSSALLRLDVTVYRFDGSKDGQLDALVDWRVRRLGGDTTDREHAGLGCRFSHLLQTRPDHVPSLVVGMQQQIGWLAQQIVDSSRQWLASGGERHCRSVPVVSGEGSVPERPAGVSRS